MSSGEDEQKVSETYSSLAKAKTKSCAHAAGLIFCRNMFVFERAFPKACSAGSPAASLGSWNSYAFQTLRDRWPLAVILLY